MSKEALLTEIDRVFDALNAKTDIPAIKQFVLYGTDRNKVMDSETIETEYKILAEPMKPFFEILLRFEPESEEFKQAARFFDYAAAKIHYPFSASFEEIMEEFEKLGLSLAESMLLDLIVTDFTPDKMMTYHVFSYQTGVLKKLKEKDSKRFCEIRDILFSLPKGLISLNTRFKYYFCAFLYGAMSAEIKEDFPRALTQYEFIEDCMGKNELNAMSVDFSHHVAEALKVYHFSLYKEAGKDDDKYRDSVIREGDRVFPYRYQFMGMLYHSQYDYVQKALNVIMGRTELIQSFFAKGNPYHLDSDSLLYLAENYFQGHSGDAISSLNALFFSSSKKIINLAAKVVDKRRDDFREQFAAYMAENPKLSKDNAAAVKALTDKWADEDDAGKGFDSFEAVEAYAASCKIQSGKLLAGFDFTVPVYDITKTKRVSENTLKVFLDKYFCMKEIYRNKKCDKMAAWFDRESFIAFVDGVYDTWQASDYDNKLKAAVVPYCFYTSNGNLLKLKKQCVTLCDNARHALTAYIITVIAMNGGKFALMLVDGIANKFPYAKAKQVAKDAMAAAAAKYKIPVDVLGDMVIPTYDFDESGKRVFHYGEDCMTLSLMPDGDLQIYRDGKILKTLPAPSDEASRNAKKELSDLKKDIKTLIKLQTVRLERALLIGRCWTFKDFKRVFVKNPMMRGLASNLVWGIYEADGTLRQAFRYNLDGTTVNADYDDVTPSDGDIVALVHPCDLTAPQTESWRAFVADNEIVQPFAQINQKLCYPPKKNLIDGIIDLTEYKFNFSHAQKIVNKYNMTRLPVQDGGSFEGWYLEDEQSGYGIELTLEDLYIGCDREDGCHLTLRFYEQHNADYYWSHTENGHSIPPESIPTRITSSILASIGAVIPELATDGSGQTVKMPFKAFVNENDVEFEEPEIPAVPQSAEIPDKTAATAPPHTKEAEAVQPIQEKVSAAAQGAKTANSSDTVALEAYLEFTDGTSNKFWKIAVTGGSHTVTFGRIGTAGVENVKEFSSEAEAVRDAEKLIASKVKKGYVKK